MEADVEEVRDKAFKLMASMAVDRVDRVVMGQHTVLPLSLQVVKRAQSLDPFVMQGCSMSAFNPVTQPVLRAIF